jgi:hypothetical protein
MAAKKGGRKGPPRPKSLKKLPKGLRAYWAKRGVK